MAYETKHLRRQKVRYNSDNDDNPVTYQLVIDGAKVTPTSATIQINDPDGTSVLAAAAMTASGTLLTYKIDTTTVADFPIKNGYRANIVVTYNALTYDRHIMLDVVRLPLNVDVGIDQLVALDDTVRHFQWDSDEDLSEIINAMRDVLQAKIENKVFSDDNPVNEDMILDSSGVAVAFRYMVLAQIFSVKDPEAAVGQETKVERYDRLGKEVLAETLDNLQWDTGQDGTEDEGTEVFRSMRLVL